MACLICYAGIMAAVFQYFLFRSEYRVLFRVTGSSYIPVEPSWQVELSFIGKRVWLPIYELVLCNTASDQVLLRNADRNSRINPFQPRTTAVSPIYKVACSRARHITWRVCWFSLMTCSCHKSMLALSIMRLYHKEHLIELRT